MLIIVEKSLVSIKVLMDNLTLGANGSKYLIPILLPLRFEYARPLISREKENSRILM